MEYLLDQDQNEEIDNNSNEDDHESSEETESSECYCLQMQIVQKDNQAPYLHVELQEEEVFYFNAELIASNIKQTSELTLRITDLTFMNRIMKEKVLLEQFTNKSEDDVFIDIKHPNRQGGILIIDLEVYKQNMYFLEEALIGSRKSLSILGKDNYTLLEY